MAETPRPSAPQQGWDSPVLTLTDEAKQRVVEVMDANDARDHSLRIGIAGRRGGSFHYNMELVPPDEQRPDDTRLDYGEFSILVDAQSLPHLRGSTVDFLVKPTNPNGGFEIENPNPIWTDERARVLQQVIDEQINPQVAAHGGYVELLDVRDRTAYVMMGGGCQGCGMASVTLKQGVEVLIKDAMPEIEEIVDTTDHAAGTNPYYQPAKK